jgi:hypothetical protein
VGWPELFGLAMIEAMRKGTPVDAFAATVIRRDPAGRGHHLPRRAALEMRTAEEFGHGKRTAGSYKQWAATHFPAYRGPVAARLGLEAVTA